MKKIILSTILSTVLLFFWGGLTQLFPWGVPTAQSIASQATGKTEIFQAPGLIELPVNALTTEKFDDQMVNKISILTTDKTFSWIITKPVEYYSVSSYFIKEILTQLLVSGFIALLLYLTADQNLAKRIYISSLAALLAV